MKIKELKRTVNMSWSPAEHYPTMLVTGSAAQQVDASFSTNSYLELHSLNLGDSSLDFEMKSSIQTKHKFQKLVWSGAGIIVGGCDGGLLEFYSAEKLLNNASDSLIGSSSKHNGHVSALDVNPYQKNLLASGASDSEIFIWDLNNTSQPMAPGNRSQPYDHVQGLAWNQQVQHILGSTFATRCLVWDLRKNEPIMKLSDSQFRTRWRALAWHPGVATQLCVASEDDQAPVVQLWDLRLAASPLATLEGHEKGALALSWSRHDHDLLLSAGRDGRLLAWNPNNTKPGGELVVEVNRQSAWVFDVAWAAREPGLLAAASFDHSLALHTLFATSSVAGGSSASNNNIMDSFGGADSFAALPAVQLSAPPPAAPAQPPRAPRWMRRPAAAKFAFGGKLVTFEKCPQETESRKLVYISQVVSEPEIVEKAFELDTVIGLTLSQEPGAAEKLAEYCRAKGDAATDQHERYTWFFLRANFLPTYRTEILNLLGFKQEEISSKFKSQQNNEPRAPQDNFGLSRDAQTLIEKKLASIDLEPTVTNVVIPSGDDSTSLICRALVCGNIEEAVDLCLEAKRVSDALIIASLGSPELQYRVQRVQLSARAADPVALVTGALLRGAWDGLLRAVAPPAWRHALAALAAHCDPHALAHYCEVLGDKLAAESEPALRDAATLCYVCGAHGDALAARALRAAPPSAAELARQAELALLTRAAAAVQGRPAQEGGQLDALLSRYAARVAAQGCLHSALAALRGARSDLRERLHAALAAREQKQQQQQQQQYQPQHQQTSTRARTVSTHSNYNENIGAYKMQPPPAATHEPQSWAASSHPPRPASVSSQPGGITSRSKYKVDPSVQSAPLYNQYSFNNPPQAPSYGYNSPIPDQYSAASVPSHNFTPINQQQNYPSNPPPLMNPLNSAPLNPAPMNPMNPLNPVPLNPMNPVNPAPLNPMIPLNPSNNATLNPIHPPMNGNYYQAAEAAPAPKPAAPGWNDPPMLTSRPKPKQEIQQQAPITHPLFGVEPPQYVPLVPTSQYPGQQAQYPGQQTQYPGQPAPYPGQQQQYPGQMGQYPAENAQYPGQYADQQYQGSYQQGMQTGYPQQVESPAPAEPAPVQKGPLPAEYVDLQTVFDSLRNACSEKATNQQMKRKLEDVQRRLETLYDMLREHRLSEAALAQLQEARAAGAAGEHARAVAAVAALATGPDFAAAAAFLPGLKMLFLLAAQLQALPQQR
ncbi:protein transport protein Sec31A isoform X2 [Vanessa cardui]|uniref:protein transport protein Sec31A isoform X2 n=1 Tax=Vanessa cardui TaxID=171605 RepID=UPI001F13557C|nr:protein transport protein Sec31A isoform X2 [Vanessa cardui]